MATSGSNTITVANATNGEVAVQLRLSWSTVSHNVAGNSSVVRFTLQVIAARYGAMTGSATKQWNITVDGVQRASGTFTVSQGANSTKTLGTVDVTIWHNADGTKSFSANGFAQFRMNFNGYKGDYNVGLSGTLNTIPRASTPSVGSARTIGSAISISTNRASSSFTHTLTYKFGSASGTIATGVGASVNWTPPLSLASQIPNATSGQLTITCVTYNGGTNIGSKTTTVNLSVPSSVKPSFTSSTVSDGTSYLSQYGVYVLGASKINVTAKATSQYGATITKYTVSGGGGVQSNATGTFTNVPVSGNLPTNGAAGTIMLTLTATDSRGRTITGTKAIQCAQDSNPELSVSAFRATGGVEDDESETVRVAISGSVTDINGKGLNSGTVKIEYKLTTSGTWTQANSANRGESFSFSYDIGGIDNTSSYDIRVTVTDKFGLSARQYASIGTATPLMDFRSTGKGVAIGRTVTADRFQVGFPSTFYDETELRGIVQGINSYGYTGSGSTYRYVEIARAIDTTDYVRSAAYVRVTGSIGGYSSGSRGHIDIMIPIRGLTYENASGNINYIFRGRFINTSYCNIEVYLGTDDIVHVYLCLKGYYCYDVIIRGEGITCPMTTLADNTMPTGTYLFNLVNLKNHYYLQNDAAIAAENTSGSVVSLLRLNTSNQVELNWTSGGLRGRCMKQLWSGTWSSGSLTISELPYYNQIAVVFDYYGSKYLIHAMRGDSLSSGKMFFSGIGSAWDHNGGIAFMSFMSDYASATSIRTGGSGARKPIRVETQTGFVTELPATKIYGLL